MKKILLMNDFTGVEVLKDMKLKDAKKHLFENYEYTNTNQIAFLRKGQVYYIDFWEQNPKVKPFPKGIDCMIAFSLIKED